MFTNLRYAVRSLRGAPVFTTIAIVTLALGIGVNSSMYSVVNTVMFGSAPFPRPESIVNLNGRTPQAEFLGFSAPEIDELRARPSAAIAALAATNGTMEPVTLPDQLPEQMQGTAVDANLFKVLETQPLLGRTFTAEECVAGRDTVVLITEELWRRQFGSRPDVLSQTMRVNGRVFTIIGVLPTAYSAPFIFGEGQYFRPLIFSEEQAMRRDRREFSLMLRLAPGVSPNQALANLAPLADRWAKDHPESYPNYHFRMQRAGRIGGSGNVAILSLQMGLAAAILAIACANLANLQMSRAAARVRDLAIRSALGASRWRLIQQQVLESLVVAIAGGALGLLVAEWSNQLIGRNIQIGFNSTLALPIDGRVLAYTAAISIVAGFGFGLIPAWLASRTDVNAALKQQSRGTTGGRSQGWIRNILVVGQVALSLTLLSVAAMMVRGLDRIIDSRPTWDSESILTANVAIEERSYGTPEKRRAFHEALATRLARIPGVEACSLSSQLPAAGGTQEHELFLEGQDANAKNLPRGQSYLVTPGYFQTLGIRLVEGRTFAENVSPTSPEQAVISQSLAKHFWPHESALGKRLGSKGPDGKISQREIIGVVADADDAIQFSKTPNRLQFYSTLTHNPWAWFQIALRGSNPGHFANDLRRAVLDVSPDVAARFVWTVQDMRNLFLHNLVVINGVLLAFALLGLVLASVGIYGIVSNNVSRRMTEFGIRLALGAQQFDVLHLVLRQSLRLSLIGLAVGGIGAFLLGVGLRQSLGPLVEQSYSILAVTALVIFAVALLATWLPARRATQADPIAALRAE